MSFTLHANKLLKNISRIAGNRDSFKVYEHLTQQSEKMNIWNLFIYDIKNKVVIQYHRECLFERGINSDYHLQNTYTLQQFKETWFGRYTIHYLL